MKKILVLSDTHCGAINALTPPKYNRKDKFYVRRKNLWTWYRNTIKEINPDITLVNGDSIDGSGKKSGGREQLTTDLLKQTDIAIEAFQPLKSSKLYFSYGTGYHTGNECDYEDIIAKAFNAEIYGKIVQKIERVNFNLRHHVGSSGIPHGRATAIIKEKMWNNMKVAEGKEIKADILIRSHVHYHIMVSTPNYTALTTPALQYPESVYGRRCTGDYDMGLIEITVSGKKYDIKLHTFCY